MGVLIKRALLFGVSFGRLLWNFLVMVLEQRPWCINVCPQALRKGVDQDLYSVVAAEL